MKTIMMMLVLVCGPTLQAGSTVAITGENWWSGGIEGQEGHKKIQVPHEKNATYGKLSPNKKEILYDEFEKKKLVSARGKKPKGVTDIEIFVVDANGKNVEQLTDNTVDDYHPDWSANGKQIVFVSSQDFSDRSFGHENQLCVMRKDGSNRRYLFKLTDGNILWPQFSSQGAIAFFVSYSSIGRKHGDLVVRDGDSLRYVTKDIGTRFRSKVAGGKKERKRSGVHVREYLWSPDGSYLAYLGKQFIALYSSETNRTKIEALKKIDKRLNGHWPQNLRWKPDGTELTLEVKETTKGIGGKSTRLFLDVAKWQSGGAPFYKIEVAEGLNAGS